VPIPVEDYAYDGEGNRTASHLSAIYASNDHNQLLDDDSYTYAYDAKGNRISRTAKASGAIETYTYDSQNRLVGYAGASTASYAYDALDRRIAKTVNGAVTSYVYDTSMEDALAFDDILLEFDASASPILTRRWVHSDAVDEPVGFESYTSSSGVGSGTEHAMFADRQGSVIWVTQPATGTVVAGYEYDGYGQITQTGGTLTQPYGYTGREYDAESGLYHYRARAYDPAAGVFVQVDPIEFGGGSLSVTNYTSNDPFNWSDPTGLSEAAQGASISTKSAAEGVMRSTTTGVAAITAAGYIAGIIEEAINLHNYPRRIAPNSGREITCTEETIRKLNELRPKDEDVGSCFGNLADAENLRRMTLISKVIFVRTAITAACYRGTGDGGHDAATAQLFTRLNHCYNLIQTGRRK
jgi:RHS repeat-associated protein